jgi:hypothetical protein
MSIADRLAVYLLSLAATYYLLIESCGTPLGRKDGL